MLDIQILRQNPERFQHGLDRRGISSVSASELSSIDQRVRSLQTELQDKQAERNTLSKQIGGLMKDGKRDEAEAAKSRVSALKNDMTVLEEKLAAEKAILDQWFLELPNFLHDDVPEGEDDDENVEISRWGDIPTFDFEPKNHFELEALVNQGLLDFETAAKMSGSRFYVLRAGLARLERALGQFFIDQQVEQFSATEVAVPLMVSRQTMTGSGHLPKFSEDAFSTTDDRWLIPTSEVSLVNSVSNSIIPTDQLPIRMVALTPNFRSEAGSAGRDTRGLVRVHQFQKVEMVTIAHPEKSEEELEHMLMRAEKMAQMLEIPYRVVLLCTGDTGAWSHKTYDIELWFPGQNTYREISSVSICTDYQARRINARHRANAEDKTQLVHTLNGTGLAVTRCLACLLENYQNEDGSVRVPKVLQPYMGGVTVIGR